MKNLVIELAMNRLKVIEQDNDDVNFISLVKDNRDTIVCFFRSGHNVELSTDEIIYQAKEHLNDEINKFKEL